jgi:SNF2 family DNA or RNA helicase
MPRKSASTQSNPSASGAPPLFKHQIVSVKTMDKAPRVLDASDPGTGKTRVQIELFAMRRKRGGKCALVIAPKSLLRSAWQDDFRKFAPNVTTVVAPADKREEAFKQEADVYITNTDATKWLAKQPPGFFKRFDTLIIDELSSFKHHTSQRSKALNKIKRHFEFRYGLTGTPNSNGITDIWHQMFVLDDGKRLGTSFYKFRNEVCVPRQVGPQPNMLQWEDKPNAEDIVALLLADAVVRHKFEECIDIPENHTYSVPFYMSPKQTKIYQLMERDALAITDSGRTISTVNAAGVTTKLLQIASGASYSDEGTGFTPLHAKVADALGYLPIDSSRYELVADLVEERAHCVVFFNWNHQRDELLKEFKTRGITCTVIDGSTTDKNRKEAVDHFQAGFYRVLLAHPQSAAHGLTLTKGTSTIWASPTYNLEHFLQGNRRIYRAGQTQKTETIVVIAPGTIEEKVYEKLMAKNSKQMSMLELLKDYFHGN